MEAQTVKKKSKPAIIPKKRSHGQLHEGQHASVLSILHGSRIQPKLRIGQPNDKYEQEADRVAEKVLRMHEPTTQKTFQNSVNNRSESNFSDNNSERLIQRQDKLELEQDEELIQAKSLAHQITPLIQHQESIVADEYERQIQTKETGHVTPEVTPAITKGIQSLQGGGQPLSKSERNFFEPRFGADFSDVLVRSDARAASVAQSINARAFTHGKNVMFGAGEYSSGSDSGRKLLAHELTHVVQQGGSQLQQATTLLGKKMELKKTIESDPIGTSEFVQREKEKNKAGTQLVDPAPATDAQCEPQNGPVAIGNLTRSAAKSMAHLTAAKQLYTPVKSMLKLYIRVINAGDSEKATFSETEKKLAEMIAKKESLRANLPMIALQVGTMALSVTASFATADRAISYVASLASAGEGVRSGKEVVLPQATNLRALQTTYKTFTEFAGTIRADLGELSGVVLDVINTLVSTELNKAGIEASFIGGEILKSVQCSQPYSAKDLSDLKSSVSSIVNEASTLANQLKPIQAMAQSAADKGAVKLLKAGSNDRKGYDTLVKELLSGNTGVQLITHDGKKKLLLNNVTQKKLNDGGFNTDRSSGFHRFDYTAGKHRLFRIVYLDAARRALIEPLTNLGLVHRVMKGNPFFDWANLPGCPDCDGPAVKVGPMADEYAGTD